MVTGFASVLNGESNWHVENADCVAVLRSMPDECVQCCVTSPPYWGLRDYGVDGQLGLEKTPDEYVSRMVGVFREVRRVLREDGTLWLNLGDSYGAVGGNINRPGFAGCAGAIEKKFGKANGADIDTGLRPKNLIGIPWRVAFALQADGWYLRQDIIWHKPNPMPESVRDRCTKAHEYIFLLAKSERYFYDAEAVKEPFADERKGNPGKYSPHYQIGSDRNDGNQIGAGGDWNSDGSKTGRNRRSVWTVTPKPFKGAHFAVFPPDLIEPCILAGCPSGGVVLDPFTGSGTTGMVAVKHGRRFVGSELNPEYADMARGRVGSVETAVPA